MKTTILSSGCLLARPMIFAEPPSTSGKPPETPYGKSRRPRPLYFRAEKPQQTGSRSREPNRIEGHLARKLALSCISNRKATLAEALTYQVPNGRHRAALEIASPEPPSADLSADNGRWILRPSTFRHADVKSLTAADTGPAETECLPQRLARGSSTETPAASLGAIVDLAGYCASPRQGLGGDTP